MSDPDEHGVALVIVMMTMTLLTALGMALTIATITETAIAANYRDAAEALYTAEAAVEYVMQEIAAVSDWRDALSEPGQSAFVDGPADGSRTVGAVTIDLARETSDVNAMAAEAAGVVYSPSVLYAFGRFQDLVPSSMNRSPMYVAVWVGDRSETSADEPSAPESVSILGQAYGARGSRHAVEAIVAKADTSTVRVLSWRDLR